VTCPISQIQPNHQQDISVDWTNLDPAQMTAVRVLGNHANRRHKKCFIEWLLKMKGNIELALTLTPSHEYGF
jgi:hypothetical protein